MAARFPGSGGKAVRAYRERLRPYPAAPPGNGGRLPARRNVPGWWRNTSPSRWRTDRRAAGHLPQARTEAYRGQAALPAHTFGYGRPAGQASTDMRYERMSTDRSDCRLSSPHPWAATLCNFTSTAVRVHRQCAENPADDGEELAQHALSVTVQPEQCREPGMDGDVSDEAHTKGVLPVRCHCNVIAWAEDARSSAVSGTTRQPACHDGMHPPQHRRHSGALLGGHSGQCGATFLPKSHSIRSWSRRSASLPGRPITEVRPVRSASAWRDRQNGIPVHVDISDLPMKSRHHHQPQ